MGMTLRELRWCLWSRWLGRFSARQIDLALAMLVTLAGLAVNAVFHIAWMDSLAALVAVPILIKEGRSAWRGQNCGCC